MKSAAKLFRSGGHRRGDLWTSGQRTTLHSPELYDQMVVAQTAEEKRIRSEGNVPAEQAKIKSAARAYREHYKASVEHLGIDAQSVGSPDSPKLTSRPSYLGPTLLSGYAGERATVQELDVGFGIRKDQFVYYDDEGRRIQHPASAQILAEAGLATAREINETLEQEYRLSLESKKKSAAMLAETQTALCDDNSNNLITDNKPPSRLTEMSPPSQGEPKEKAVVNGVAADDVRSMTAAPNLPASGHGCDAVADGSKRDSITSPNNNLRQPSPEVAALTRVKDKRDLLYNQKLRTVWDSAFEDPVRGSGLKGPKRNIDNGSVVTKGTERTVYREMRCSGAARPLKGEEGYYEVADTVADSGARLFGGALRGSSAAATNKEAGAQYMSTNVFGQGEEQFRNSMAPSEGTDAHLSCPDEESNSVAHERRPRRTRGSFENSTDENDVTSFRAATGDDVVDPSHLQKADEFKSSAEKDIKYDSQRVDLNNPRVGPEFFQGADVAMDADLRKALDIKMRLAREGKPRESLSKILAEEEKKDGNNRFGALTEAKLAERVEKVLDEKEAARLEGSHAERSDAPRRERKLNLAAPRNSRRNTKPSTAETSATPADEQASAAKQSFFGRLFNFSPFTGLSSSEHLTEEQILEQKRQLAAERERMIRDGEAFADDTASEDSRYNARLGIRSTRATPSNSPVGRRKPITYDSARELSTERLMMQIMGAGVELNTTTGDSRELFSGGFDFWGNRRRGANSYTEAANAGGRFANRLTPNYFTNDSLHAGMQASSLHHRRSGLGEATGAAAEDGGLGPSAVRNRAFAAFQKQSREDPYGAARNIGVGAGGLSAISNAQSSGGAGVGSSYSHSSEGEKAVKQFTFRQVLKQLDHSRMQPTNHDDMFSDSLKYLEAYIDMSNTVSSAEGAASSINVTGEDSVADDVLLPRAALKGRMVGLLFYTESQRSKVFMERLEAFAKPYRGDFVILGISYGAYERRDLLKKHRFCCIPTTMGARYVARDAGFIASWWHPYPSLFIVDGSTGKVITKYGYAGVNRRPETCFGDWMEGGEGITPLDVVLSRFDLLPSPLYTDRDSMTQRVVDDFKLEKK